MSGPVSHATVTGLWRATVLIAVWALLVLGRGRDGDRAGGHDNSRDDDGRRNRC